MDFCVNKLYLRELHLETYVFTTCPLISLPNCNIIQFATTICRSTTNIRAADGNNELVRKNGSVLPISETFIARTSELIVVVNRSGTVAIKSKMTRTRVSRREPFLPIKRTDRRALVPKCFRQPFYR